MDREETRVIEVNKDSLVRRELMEVVVVTDLLGLKGTKVLLAFQDLMGRRDRKVLSVRKAI